MVSDGLTHSDVGTLAPVGDEDSWMTAELMLVVAGRCPGVVTDPARRQRVRGEGVRRGGPFPEATHTFAFDDVAGLGVGQPPAVHRLR